MKREEWLLLFLDLPLTDDGRVRVVDPLRIQKGLFYFAQEAGKGLPSDSVYSFEPYMYGPCSFDIYRDLDSLVDKGLVQRFQIETQNWPYYGLTHGGREVTKGLRDTAEAHLLEALTEIRTRVMSLSFLDLLRKVYREHGSYAVNSIIKP